VPVLFNFAFFLLCYGFYAGSAEKQAFAVHFGPLQVGLLLALGGDFGMTAVCFNIRALLAAHALSHHDEGK